MIDPKDGRILELEAVVMATEAQRNNALADHAATVGRLAIANKRLEMERSRAQGLAKNVAEKDARILELERDVEALKPKEA